MTQTLESFIEKLRAEGVEAGRKAAEEIRREAQQQADQLLRDAEAKARQIVEAAEAEGRRILARTQTDLKLAARDTVARLRDALNQAVIRVLSQAVGRKLQDADFLADLIREIARQYAEADAAGQAVLRVNVPESMRQRLTHWAIATFHQEGRKGGISLELAGALSNAGFEYRVTEGTIEITPESVVQVLSEIVTSELHELIGAALGEGEGPAAEAASGGGGAAGPPAP